MNIGSRIRHLRLSKNMKIAELAEAVGVDAANISRLETGKQKQFSEQTLNRLAHALSEFCDFHVLRQAKMSYARSYIHA
ncbi:helix-turn-helix domain-containing protein, partial [Escherichia sp. HC-CC]